MPTRSEDGISQILPPSRYRIHMVDNNAYAHNYQRNTTLRNTPPSLAALREFYNATVVLPG